MCSVWYVAYLTFLPTYNKAFGSETFERVIANGTLICPLKLVPSTGRIHNVEFPGEVNICEH